jgi:hypothetical protein
MTNNMVREHAATLGATAVLCDGALSSGRTAWIAAGENSPRDVPLGDLMCRIGGL